MFKALVKKLVSKTGYVLHKQDPGLSLASRDGNSMIAGLQRMKDIGISPKSVIDVGAAQGSWTKTALNIWPSAIYHLIEPLIENELSLKELQVKNSKIQYYLSVAGESAGTISLHVSKDLDGSGIYGSNSQNNRNVSVIPIDSIETSDDVLIKLDTHGFESPILKGSFATLKRTSLLVIEVYGFYVSPTCLLFNELSAELDKLGFRLIDMVDIMRRPGDQAFWQCDAFFLRKDHPVFQRETYA